jgi:starch phosphorylase
MIAVPIDGREVWIRPWFYAHHCPLGHCVPVLLLDTELDQNQAEDRKITGRLYGGDSEYRLKQEIVLGIGGVRALEALGFDIRTYHMNEGHAALLAVQLLRKFHRPAEDIGPGESSYDPARVRERCVFTTHTPVEADHQPYFPRLSRSRHHQWRPSTDLDASELRAPLPGGVSALGA